jgi:hypothetical protein
MSGGRPTTLPADAGVGLPGGVPANCTTIPCPAAVTVTVAIALSGTVACPGHPMVISANGTPSGGTYSWTISDTRAQLVDGTGNPISTGSNVNLRGFHADDTSGVIPARTVTVSVTYTHPSGTASDSKVVNIHKIEFKVTNKAITRGFTEVQETATAVQLWTFTGPEMATDPTVEIQLDASCPRKADCAANHRVGWLQTMLTDTRQARYSHTSLDVVVATPIRDVWNATIFPFYSTVTAFIGDRDKQTAHHEDSPSFPSPPGAPWTDPRVGVGASPPPGPPPATNLQLRRMNFSDSFTAWLVVQNIEWAAHHLTDSFAYQGHFDWSMQLNVTVDTTKAVGSRVSPKRKKITAPAKIQRGKGSGTPNLAAPIFNTSAVLNVNPAPGI